MAGNKGRLRPRAVAEAQCEEALRQTLDRLEEGVTEVFTSGRYAQYLSVMSRFHNYSANNCLLIAMQRPDATLVAGYRAWQDKFGRQVRRGEHGIKILSPVVVREPAEAGEAAGEDGGRETRRLVGFRAATVFDVSQTEGKDLPSIAVDELRGGVGDFDAIMAAVEKVGGYPVEFETIRSGAKGYFSHADPKRIVIQEGMSQAQTLKTALHELAHSVMHDPDSPTEGGARPDRGTREVQAESVAFVVSSWLGLDTGEYSFGYVASWSDGRELGELRASLDEIRRVSHGIIEGIEAEVSGAREPDGGERQPDVAREAAGRGGRALSERAAAARATAPARDDAPVRRPDEAR